MHPSGNDRSSGPRGAAVIASVREHTGWIVAVVSGGHFLAHFYMLAFPPLFPLLVPEFGLSNTQLGLLMSIMALSMFVLQIPVGLLVDRVGAKRVFVAGIALVSGGTLLAGFAGSYLALLAAVFVVGIGQAAFHPADFALLDAATDEGAEGKSFGVHTFAGYAGFAVAPFVVGGIGLAAGWRQALFATGAVGLVYAVVSQLSMAPVYRRRMETTATDDADSDDGGRARALLSNPPLLLMFGFFVVATMGNKGIQTFTGVFLTSSFGFEEAVGNLTLTTFFTLTALGVLVGGALADRYRPAAVIGTVLALAAGGVALAVAEVLPLTPRLTMGLFGVTGLCFGLALPSRDRLINGFSTSSTTGQSFGFAYTGLPLGAMISPVLLGAVIDLTTARVAFGLIAACLLLAGLIAASIGTERFVGTAVRGAPDDGN
jgi:MFS family permease